MVMALFQYLITMIKNKNVDQHQILHQNFRSQTLREDRQFYVCAEGLGGVLEHLMYINAREK